MKTRWIQAFAVMLLSLLSIAGATKPSSFGFYRVTAVDRRRCAAPLCGGFYMHKINTRDNPVYVANINLTTQTQDVIRNLEQYVAKYLYDLVVYSGTLVPYPTPKGKPNADIYNFSVRSVYLGLPGVPVSRALRGKVFYSLARDHAGVYVRELNQANVSQVTIDTKTSDLTVVATAAADVDWQKYQVSGKGALIAAKRVPSRTGSVVVKAAELFIRLPVTTGPCAPQTAKCPSKRHPFLAYKRSPDLCLHTRCTTRKGFVCVQGFPVCADGYRLACWPTAPGGCNKYSCDPEFAPVATPDGRVCFAQPPSAHLGQ